MKKELTKILLIEDNPGDARLVKEALAEAGAARFKLDWVTDLDKGFARLEKHPVDAILLDLTLPDSTGFATFKKVYDRLPQVAIILLTGVDDDIQAAKAVREGAQDYLVKGQVTGELLVRSIQYAVERKQAEETLRENEEHYRTIFEGVEDAIFVETPSGQILDVNQRACEIFGYTREQFLTKTVADLVPSEKNIVPYDQDDPPTLPDRPYETINVRADGEQFPIELSIRLQKRKGELVLFVVGRDVTERKLAEEALRESERKYRKLHESMIDGFVSVSMDGKILESNPIYRKMMGYSAAELAQLTYFDITPEKWHSFEQDILENQILKRGHSGIYEKEYRRKDGSIFPVEIHTVLMQDESGEPSGMWAIVRDITDRKKAEEALRQTEERYRTAFYTSPDAININRLEDGLYVDINEGFTAIMGYTRSDAIGKTSLEINIWVDPADRARLVAGLRKDGQVNNLEAKFRAKDGRVVIGLMSAKVLMLEDVPHILSITRDIEEMKQTEAARRESEERYRLLFDLSPDAIAVYQDGKIIFANPATAKLVGAATPEELVGKLMMDFVHPDYRQVVIDRARQQLVENKAVPVLEEKIIRLDGSVVDVDVTAGPIYYQKKLSTMVIIRDITERKRAEIALSQSEAHFRSLFENMVEGVALHRLVFDEAGRPINYRLVDLNLQFEVILGLKRADLLDALATEIYNVPEAPYLNEYSRVVKEGEPIRFETYYAPMDKFFSISVAPWGENGFATIFSDITNRKRAEEALAKQAEELRQRNEELARLYRASGSLISGSSLNLPELARTIVATVQREFGQANCSLLIVQKSSNELARMAVAGPYADQVRDKKLTLDGTGVVPQAIRTGQVVNTRDVRSVPDYIPNWESAQSELTIPLKVGDSVIGAIDVQSSVVDAFSPDDERLMTIFAERAALALEHTRLYSQTEHQLQRIASLHTIDMAIASSFDLNTTLSIILDQLSKLLDVHAADILVFDRGLQAFKYASGHGFRSQAVRHLSYGLGDGYAWKVAWERRILTIENFDPKSNEWQKVPELASEGFVSYVGVPLIAKGQLEGVLEIFHREPLELDREDYAFLEMLGSQAAIAIDNIELFNHLQSSNADLIQAYDSTLEGWATALELRDKETEGHTRRVADLTLQLARVIQVPDALMVQIYRGALLHDIGKMGVPDSIVLKPGPLTVEEWAIMRKHPEYAYQMLSPIAYLRSALDIPYCHHEKWDGTGYPRGLKGEQIPLAARVFALVDVWDALTSDRPYRQAWTESQAREYIQEQSGRHFDPNVAKLFLTLSLGS